MEFAAYMLLNYKQILFFCSSLLLQLQLLPFALLPVPCHCFEGIQKLAQHLISPD